MAISPRLLAALSHATIHIAIAGCIGFCVILATMTMTNASAAERSLPKYEVGLGIGGLSYPHYPSSDQRETDIFPFPYFIYRGSSVKVGRGGIVGELFDYKSVTLDLSLSGSLAVNSDDNDAREGMDDLDYTFEFGPSIEILAYESEDEDTTFEIRFPLRAVFATDFSFISYEGAILEPDVKFSHRFNDRTWSMTSAVRVLFANSDYYDYFHGVDRDEVRLGRPAYEPDGGYGGVTLSASVTKNWGRVSTSLYGAYQFLDGVEYEDGPLYRQDDAITIGFVAFIRLWESDERAPAGYDE